MENILEEVQGEESKKTIGKRRLLALATLAAAGLSIKPLIEKAHAASGQPLYIGSAENAADDGDETMLTVKVDSAPMQDIWEGLVPLPSALTVKNTGIQQSSPPVHHPPIGILGICDNGMGVSGLSDSHLGVHGRSTHGIGTAGKTEDEIGVQAIAESEDGTALKVEGKSSFSTVGSGTIPRLRKSFTVSVASGLMTDKSHVSVTLTSDPTVLGGDAAVSWIQRDPANSRFTINLTKAVGRDTTFTYFIVEP